MPTAPLGTVSEASGEVDGDGRGDGEGESDGDGSGEVDGDGSGDGEGKMDGAGDGSVVGDGNGEGSGSPTCLTVRGTSGLRRERIVEGTLGGAIGCESCWFLTSSRLGRTPSGVPATAIPFS